MHQTHGRLPQYSHSAIDAHVRRRRYLDKLCKRVVIKTPRQELGTRTRRINATNIELSQIFTISPNKAVIAFRWDHPLLAFGWQTVQDSLPKGPIRDVKL